MKPLSKQSERKIAEVQKDLFGKILPKLVRQSKRRRDDRRKNLELTEKLIQEANSRERVAELVRLGLPGLGCGNRVSWLEKAGKLESEDPAAARMLRLAHRQWSEAES